MKKAFLALLLLVGAAAMASLAYAQEQPSEKSSDFAQRQAYRGKSGGLRMSATLASDTIWVGHSHGNHSGPNNRDNIWTGDNLVKRTGTPNLACWDFDDQNGYTTGAVNVGFADSLQGWWPIRQNYKVTGTAVSNDKLRTWWALDHGNMANYVLPGNPNRHYGVVGVWHSDPGTGGSQTNYAIRWSPLAGSASAWCGLRALHDDAVIDPITGIPFTQKVMEFCDYGNNASAGPTYRNFPGYGNQWDQMLYRDITPQVGQNLTISFLYRTRMSGQFRNDVASARTGWFDGDPLAVTTGSAGANYISASDAADATVPRDSFMVYLGVPVNDDACVRSDYTTDIVYDKARRWFSEVIQRFPSILGNPMPPMIELTAMAGENPADTSAATPTFGPVSVTPAQWGPIANYADNPTPGKVRLVFRVKTNVAASDEDYKTENGTVSGVGGYSSYGRGAAMIDNVSIDTGSGATVYGFESEAAIDNNTATSASSTWKSTGKPTAVYVHPVDVATLASTWADVCGPQGSAVRTCNMDGVVADFGNADDGDGIADSRYSSMKEAIYGMVSPAIDLVNDGVNPTNQGIPADHVDPNDDYYLWYDIYQAACKGSGVGATGAFWTFGCFAYPNVQNNGAEVWSDRINFSFILSDGATHCYWDWEVLKGEGLIFTSAASGVPDSLRLYFGAYQRCFQYGLSTGCNSRAGLYIDNISLGLVNNSAAAGEQLGNIATDIWQFYQDAFPVNGLTGSDNVAPGSSAFDTTTAYIKGPLNVYPNTSSLTRFDILADTICVAASNGTAADPRVRVDMVFRILPGPGNYQIAAGRSFPPTSGMVLLKVPTDQSTAASSDPNCFWSQYIANAGEQSAGTHHGHTYWDYLTWNSARCDTAEQNMFQVSSKTNPVPNPNGVVWSATYHESDAKASILGITHPKCFIKDTSIAATDTNIVCDGVTTPAWLAAVPQSRTGWDGSLVTKEGTKIIPDGLLTPGSHVQYFFTKRYVVGATDFAMVPDTNVIVPQSDESGYDGHRWQQFSVLPDRWKDAAFGGLGQACMLYIDENDRRGDELVWTSVMDSIGGTASGKWGAHNGWHAPGGGFDLTTDNVLLSTAFVANRNQQPGTTWDMYGVKGSESGSSCGGRIGNRLAYTTNMGTATGHQAAIGPKPNMLRQYYRMVALLSGDLNTTMLGPATNVSEDDIALLNDFLTTTTSGTPAPRGIFISGQSFVDAEAANAVAAHGSFLSGKLGVSLRNKSLQTLYGSVHNCVDLTSIAPITTTDIYAVANTCNLTNDVINVNPALANTNAVSWYQNYGSNGPYIASVYHAPTTPGSGSDDWYALTDAWDMYRTAGRYCQADGGRLAYYYKVFAGTVFPSLCSNWGAAITTLDVPTNGRGTDFVNYMKIGNSVMRSSSATITFGAANTGRVRVRLYDVTGRLVRSLADRTFQAGTSNSLVWDGRDDAGNGVARGVYFARIDYANGGASINGRVVVLR